ncbi:MAG TPA: protein phosphatase 2C domain-containing protein [Aeromicrobium sp.]|nr:protein phosphatase 2C domain-containing protein [Aeromicrobium sp.]
MATLTFSYAALTDVGLRRQNNQDSGYASGRLLVIADGMGGAAAGDLASSATLAEIRKVDRDLDPSTDGDALTALEKVVFAANHRLAELIDADPAVEGMGTTLDALLWDGTKLAFAHIGDSRAYRFREGRLTQLSTDHTFVQSLVDEGRITADEARVHPHRSLLLRAILGRDDFEPEFSWIQPAAGDRYLLCSDGLSDMVHDDAIEQALRAETIDFAATELVRLALEAGGSDNVTVVLAEFVDQTTATEDTGSSADGRIQLVGAATSSPQDRTGTITASPPSDSTNPEGFAESQDPEELRYAPRPTKRRHWIWWLVSTVIAVGLIFGIGAYAYDWSQRQYYVAADNGQVVIFRGVDVNVPVLALSQVEEVTDIKLESLPDYQSQRIEAGISAANKAEARRIVSNLSVQVTDPTPTPTPQASLNTKPTTKPTTVETP